MWCCVRKKNMEERNKDECLHISNNSCQKFNLAINLSGIFHRGIIFFVLSYIYYYIIQCVVSSRVAMYKCRIP